MTARPKKRGSRLAAEWQQWTAVRAPVGRHEERHMHLHPTIRKTPESGHSRRCVIARTMCFVIRRSLTNALCMLIFTRGAVTDVAGTACHGAVCRWSQSRARWPLVEVRDFYRLPPLVDDLVAASTTMKIRTSSSCTHADSQGFLDPSATSR